MDINIDTCILPHGPTLNGAYSIVSNMWIGEAAKYAVLPGQIDVYHGVGPGQEKEPASLKVRQGWWTTKDASAQTTSDK